MSSSDWIAVLATGVALLTGSLPFMLRRSDRQRVEIEKLRTENQSLRDANIDLKIANAQLRGVGTVIDRTFSQLPTGVTGEGGGSS